MSFIPSGEQKLKDKQNPKVDKSMNNVAKPLTQSEDFCAELMEGTMDFSAIEGEQFIVGVNTDSRNKAPMLCSTIHGPFSFYEMVESVKKTGTKHHRS